MNFKKTYLFFSTLFLFCSPSLFSQHNDVVLQKDTIYFNKKDKPGVKNKAHHYQIRPLKKEGDLFILKEYYLDGSLYLEGKTSLANYKKFEGLLTTYAPNGIIRSKMNYKNDEHHGLVESFDENGNLIASGIAERGNFINGTFLGENYYGQYIETIRNRTVVERKYVYTDYKKAKIEYLNTKNDTIKCVFFDKKGQKVGTMLTNKTHSDFYPFLGTKAEFSYTSYKKIKDIRAITTISKAGKNNKIVTKTLSGKLLAEGTYNRETEVKNGSFYRKSKVKTYVDDKVTEECFYKPDNSLLTKGIYKNNSPYTGTFCYYLEFDSGYEGIKKTYEVRSLKKEVLDGRRIIYNTEFEPLEYTTYVNGSIHGEKMRHHRFTGKKHLVQYKNNVPFEGEDSDFSIKTYRKGVLIKKVEFDFDTRKKSNITYYDANEEITKTEERYKDKWHTAHYKNGKITEGVKVGYSGFDTYKEGKKNGYFIEELEHVIIEGYYKDNRYEGEFIFTRPKLKDTLYCTYKNDRPIDGIVVNRWGKGNLFSTYKNGRKHGKEVANIKALDKAYDSVVRFYENGNKTGRHCYFKKGRLQETVTYKNHKPFNGSIYLQPQGTVSFTFKNGVLEEESKVSKSKIHITTIKYHDNVIVEQSYRLPFSEDTLRTVRYKNGVPFEGIAMIEDEVKNTATISQYKNAQKKGKEEVFVISKETTKPIIERFYKSGKLEGEVISRISQSKKDSLRGTYKNGIPQEGVFLEVLNKGLFALKYYSKSALQKQEFYKPLETNKKIETLFYEKGEPHNGINYIIYGDLVLQQYYTAGVKTKTVAWNIYDTSKNTIVISHFKVTDSIVSNREIFPNAVVTYQDTSLKNGQIVFYKEENKVGTLEFTDTEILKAELSFISRYGTTSFYINTAKEAICKSKQDSELLSIHSTIPLTLSFSKDIRNIYLSLPFINTYVNKNFTINYRNENYEKPLGSIEMRNGKPFTGEMVSYYKKEKYYYIESYFRGYRVEEKPRIKEDEIDQYYKEKYNLK
jgi:antitoxin component YwqK of YwqJK toxin-antitoxin module